MSVYPSAGSLPTNHLWEELLERFEQAWRGGKPPQLDELSTSLFPAGLEQRGRLPCALLEMLIPVDLEYRWRLGSDLARHGPLAPAPKEDLSSSPSCRPIPWCPLLEIYVERFVELGPREQLSVHLIREEYRTRHRWGDRPSRHEYSQRFPNHLARLQAELDRIDAELAGGLPEGTPPGAAQGIPKDLSQPDPYATVITDCGGKVSQGFPTNAGLLTIPGYDILEELGRGGMGVVYKARQIKANRIVALKMIRDQALAGSHELARFQTEAQAIARLQHPHIVQIFEVGEVPQGPFFSLEFVEGGCLADQLKATLLPAEQSGQLVEKLAQAIHAAHAQGVIHRDLKPQNVLMTPNGTPKVTDFGLAKRLDVKAGQTEQDQVIGTPNYMAPEQAKGLTKEIGTAADVYGLGAILYQMLTAQPPFKGVHRNDTLMQVVNDEPIAPSRLNRKIPRDLETICLKCLQKEPKNRYRSAQALGEDLRRFQAGVPILARPVSRWEKACKWVRRNPLVAGLYTSLTLILMVVAVGAAVAAFVIADARDHERDAKDEALRLANVEQGLRVEVQKAFGREKREKERAEMNAYNNSLRLSESYFAANQMQQARRVLNECQPNLRGWEWHYLRRQFNTELLTLHGHTQRVNDVVFSLDGCRLASASGGATGSGEASVKVWDTATGKELFTLHGHSALVSAVAFSPDGKRLVTGSHDRTVRLWSAGKDREEPLVITGHAAGVSSVAWSRDGRFVASGALDGSVKLWDARTSRKVYTLAGHEFNATCNCVTFSPNSKTLASCAEDGFVRLWDVERGQAVQSIRARGTGPHWVRFSPDGSLLAYTSGSNAIVWELQRGKTICTIPESGPRLAFSPDGKRLVSAGSDGMVKVWNVAKGELLFRLRGHTGAVTSIDHGARGQLASGSADKTVRIWKAFTSPNSPVPLGEKAIAFSNDGKLVAAARLGGNIVVSDARTGRELQFFNAHRAGVNNLLFASSDKRLASVGVFEDAVVIWEAVTGKQLCRLERKNAVVTSFAFNLDGKLVAVSGNDGKVALWPSIGGKPLRILDDNGANVYQVSFSPDGRHLAAAVGERLLRPGHVRVWEVKTGKVVSDLDLPEFAPLSVRFSRDGRWLVAGGQKGRKNEAVGMVHLWDAATGKHLRALTGHSAPVLGLTFTPDSRRLVSVGDELKLWDPASGLMMLALSTRGRDVLFTPEGYRLLVIGEDKTRIWDGTPTHELLVLREMAHGIVFSPDGKLLASAGYDNTVKLWDRRTGKKRILGRHKDRVRAVAFSPDGRLLASGGADYEVGQDEERAIKIKVWDIQQGRELFTLPGHEEEVTGLAFSADGKRLASASKDGTVKIWTVSTGRELRTLKGHTAAVNSVTFAPTGQLASGGDEVKLWDIETGREVGTFPDGPQTVFRVTFSPDGRRLAAAGGRMRKDGGWVGELILWDLKDRTTIVRCRGHRERVSDVAFSPDGRRLISGDRAGAVRLWNALLGVQLFNFNGHSKSVHGVAFSPDGRVAASASEDGTLRLWDVKGSR